VLRRWRTVVAASPQEGVNLAALSFRSLVAETDGLVPLESISAVILAVEPVERRPTRLRLSMYGASPVPFGVQWGSAEGCRMSKDLRLRPRLGAKGRRFDVTRVRMLHVVMNLFESICRAEAQEIIDHLQLPQAWAAFQPERPIVGDGPEFAGALCQTGLSPTELMARCRRVYESLVLYPLEFVSHEWPHARLFVEPSSVPAVQIIDIEGSGAVLTGYRGCTEFDFEADVFRVPAAPRSELARRD
jgi:hypothetical protein